MDYAPNAITFGMFILINCRCRRKAQAVSGKVSTKMTEMANRDKQTKDISAGFLHAFRAPFKQAPFNVHYTNSECFIFFG